MPTQRCDEVLVSVVLRTYDDQGRPIAEQILPAVKVFRAATPDLWGSIETDLRTSLPGVPSTGDHP